MPDPDSTTHPDALVSNDEGRKYWEGIDANVNGMLGGFPYISKVDLQGSRNFLAKLGIGTKHGQRIVDNAIEGGAGIGRITQGLLVDVAKQVDVIEPVAKFTAALRGKRGVRNISNVGLEEWQPVEGVQYDLVWTQWCVGHLTDEQLVRYLERCKVVLNPESGIIVLKENMSTSGVDVFDDMDSTVTREEAKFEALFKQAGLRVVRTEIQRGFDPVLLPVRMYALQPELLS
ncbi:alpha N-terminal protein methyltransferase 1 [Phialemonium atrogriseum]|uniref:Alpha N-terminal protein methyltransferase 1 n=1 Tax=Phialemonium atrogriseum TaxID=1093897 RepID=A0AAJ0C7H5_9PEZI|nr:alpha N-terminal protein methyltransferase 1 [Phialemonium atrogriseum]KAK1770942.1 alpha N-terminal protein methyltransferase 1 [Phialemonium atrogriseum]